MPIFLSENEKSYKGLLKLITISALVFLCVISLYSISYMLGLVPKNIINQKGYCNIEYDVEGSNREDIINKVETLNYTSYLNNIEDLNDEDYKSYVDRDVVDFLRDRIDANYQCYLYDHNLTYFFVAKNHSKLYLTYDNNTIFSVKDQDNDSLLLVENYGWNNIAWYLNFTQLPYIYYENSTILLGNVIFIEIHLDYYYKCGILGLTEYYTDQYLVLSSNLDVLMIFIPHPYLFID